MLSYKDTVLGDGPILFWRLDETGLVDPAHISDSSNNGMTGTLYGTAAIGTTGSLTWNEYYTGVPSGAFFANSTSPALILNPRDKFTGSFDISPANPTFSVEWWYKPVSFSNFNNFVGFANWGYFTCHNDANGGMYCGIQISERFTPIDCAQFRVGGTYLMSFTYDGAMARMYRNGVKIAEKTMSPPTQWSTYPAGGFNGWMGLNSTNSNAWNATFDNFSIYKTVLTDAQIQNHYQVGISGTQVYGRYESVIQLSNPTVYYRLGDASGSSPNIKDHSQTNGFPGTLVGGANGVMFQQPSLVDGRDTDGGISGTLAGNSPYILTPASTGLGAGQFSVEWWQKPSAFPTGSDINNTIGTGFTKFFAGMCSGSGEAFCGINSKDMFTARDLQQGFFQLGQAAHYVFTYDSTYGYIAKNGKIIAWKKMQPSVAWGANGFAVGSGSWAGEYDEVAVYNNALFYDEIYAHYLYGLGTASLPAPSISGALAFSGSVYGTGNKIFNTGGSYVLLSGSNFQPNTKVYVSGVQCQPFNGPVDQNPSRNLIVGNNSGKRQFASVAIPSSSGSQLLFYAPTGTLGPADVTIVNPDGQSATGSAAVTFVTASDPYHALVIADQPNLFWRLDDGSGSYHLPNYVATDANDVIYWRFDEAAAPYLSTGNGSSLPLNPPPTVTAVTSTLGIFSGAVAFPGPQNSPYYLDTGPTGTNISENANITAGCWVYLFDYGFNFGGGFGNFASILGKAYRPDSSVWAAPFWTWNLQVLNDATGRLFGQVSVAGTSHGVESNFVIPLRQWCHIGLTYDGTTLTLYGNGAPAPQGTVAGGGAIDYSAHGPYRVGGGNPISSVQSSPSDNLHGLVDDVRIANIVRNATYFTQFSGSGGPSTVADWSNHGFTGSVFIGMPNLLWQQPGLIRPPAFGQPANLAMTNIASDAPTPFIAHTGDPAGLAAPCAAGIGSGSAPNAITSFSVEWWARRDVIPLVVPDRVNFPSYRFGFSQGQFLYNITRADGQVTVGTDAANSMVINNFVEPVVSTPSKAHHYCFTFQDAGNQTGTGIIYRDGVSILSNNIQKIPTGWQAFDATGPFSGTFDEVAVYPYALTPTQVANHYSTGLIPSNGATESYFYSNFALNEGFPFGGGAEDFMWPSLNVPSNFYTGSIGTLPSPGYIGDLMWPLLSPVQEGAPGFFGAEQLFDLVTPFRLQAIQGAGFLDSQQNVQYLWNIGSGSGGGGGGGGGPPTPPAPVIQNFNPGVGISITSGTILSFDVVDANGIAPVYAAILANFVGQPVQELVYNSVNFNAQYSNVHNTITPISGGFHFTLLRDGGWPTSVTLTPIAFSSGSENT